MKDLLTEDLIKLNLECNDWEEGIKYGTAHLMNNGVDLVIIQALIGHSNVKTTSIYLHVKDYQTLNITSPLDTLD